MGGGFNFEVQLPVMMDYSASSYQKTILIKKYTSLCNK